MNRGRNGEGGGGGGGGHPDPKIRRGRGRPPEIFFSALRASFWSKNKGGGGASPPGPSPGSANEIDGHIKNLYLL